MLCTLSSNKLAYEGFLAFYVVFLPTKTISFDITLHFTRRTYIFVLISTLHITASYFGTPSPYFRRRKQDIHILMSVQRIWVVSHIFADILFMNKARDVDSADTTKHLLSVLITTFTVSDVSVQKTQLY